MRASVGDSLEQIREMDLSRILAHVAGTRREGSGVSCWLVWRTVSTGVRDAPCRVQMVALAGEARARAEVCDAQGERGGDRCRAEPPTDRSVLRHVMMGPCDGRVHVTCYNTSTYHFAYSFVRLASRLPRARLPRYARHMSCHGARTFSGKRARSRLPRNGNRRRRKRLRGSRSRLPHDGNLRRHDRMGVRSGGASY